MEINAQEVIDRLSAKLAKSEAEKVVLEVQVETLQNENANLSAQIENHDANVEAPVEGEVIG